MPRSTSATALPMHALAMSTAMRSRPQKPRQRRRSVAPSLVLLPVWPPAPTSPRCSRSQTHAASGDSVVVVAPGALVVAVLPSPLKSFPSTSTISVPDSWESAHQLGAGHDALQQLRLGQVGRGVADLGCGRRDRVGRPATPPLTKPFCWSSWEVLPAAPSDPGAVAHQDPHVDRADRGGAPAAVPLAAGGAVVVVGIGASPRRTASTASASGCFSSRNDPAESPIFHGRVSKVGPLPSSSERPMNARTSSLNDGAVERLVGGELRDQVVGEVGRDRRVVGCLQAPRGGRAA